jgi:hypothetical protein
MALRVLLSKPEQNRGDLAMGKSACASDMGLGHPASKNGGTAATEILGTRIRADSIPALPTDHATTTAVATRTTPPLMRRRRCVISAGKRQGMVNEPYSNGVNILLLTRVAGLAFPS